MAALLSGRCRHGHRVIHVALTTSDCDGILAGLPFMRGVVPGLPGVTLALIARDPRPGMPDPCTVLADVAGRRVLMVVTSPAMLQTMRDEGAVRAERYIALVLEMDGETIEVHIYATTDVHALVGQLQQGGRIEHTSHHVDLGPLAVVPPHWN